MSNFVASHSQSWGEQPIPYLESRQDGHRRFQRGFRILDALLCFETTAPQRPKLNQIRNIRPPVKIRGGVAEMSGSERRSIIVAQFLSELIKFNLGPNLYILLSGRRCAGFVICLMVKEDHDKRQRQNTKSAPTVVR